MLSLVGKLLIGEHLDISNGSGDLEFGQNGLVVKNDVNTVSIDPNNESVFNISNKSGYIFSLNDNGELVITGNITASSLTLLEGADINSKNVTGLSTVAISGSYNDLINKPTLSAVAKSGDYHDLSNAPEKLSEFTNDTLFITNSVSNLTNYHNKTEVNNLLESKANKADLSKIATKDLVDIEEFKTWVLEQIELAKN